MKIKVKLSIGYPRAERTGEITVPDFEIALMTAEEKQEYFDELAEMWANNYISISWNEEK